MARSDEKRRPLGTKEELQEFFRSPAQNMCCHEPNPPKTIGCPLWDECMFVKQKGISGPVNVAYRLYKPEGLLKENYAPCFELIDGTTQYNKNDGYFREIIGFGKGEDPENPEKEVTIKQRGTQKVAGTLDKWEAWEKDVPVPAFRRLKDVPEMQNARRAKELLEAREKRREDAGIDAVLRGGKQRDVARAMAGVDVAMETEGMDADE